MKSVIEHPKYGKIEYVENFWNGKKELIVSGVYLRPRGKTIFVGEYDELDKDFEVIGNYAAGATLKVDGEKFELVPKTKAYEYFIYWKQFCKRYPVSCGRHCQICGHKQF